MTGLRTSTQKFVDLFSSTKEEGQTRASEVQHVSETAIVAVAEPLVVVYWYGIKPVDLLASGPRGNDDRVQISELETSLQRCR